jgi:hypothetical protein
MSAHNREQVIGVLNPKRIERARLNANLSHDDLAYEIRRLSDGRLKPNGGLVRKWIKGQHKPSDGVIVVIASATGQDISYFYETDSEDDGEAALLRDLEQRLPSDLLARVVRAIDRTKVGAP